MSVMQINIQDTDITTQSSQNSFKQQQHGHEEESKTVTKEIKEEKKPLPPVFGVTSNSNQPSSNISSQPTNYKNIFGGQKK